ncbi:P-loop NTPase fold protein, partial [Atopobiaceae bacterium HCP3S3_A4]
MDRIAERVIHYMSDIDSSDDKNPHFAIAMYGEWGSGKTHYCETSLREALKRKKYKLVRISLFGLDSPNGIYGRLLSALCRMEGSKAKRMGKLAAETVANTFITTLHDHGIDLALDTETLVSLSSITDFIRTVPEVSCTCADGWRNLCGGGRRGRPDDV